MGAFYTRFVVRDWQTDQLTSIAYTGAFAGPGADTIAVALTGNLAGAVRERETVAVLGEPQPAIVPNTILTPANFGVQAMPGLAVLKGAQP